jgi:cell wall assembly regulator SMI1
MKCWSIALGVDYVATRTGCSEGKVRTRMQWFPNNDKASAWLESEIESKLKQDYVEVTGNRKPKSRRGVREQLLSSPSKKANRVNVVWKRIEQWLSQHTSDGSIPLPCGVSESEIKKVEAAIDAKLPPDVHRSYAVHDGSGKIGFAFGLLLSLAQLVNSWLGFQNSRRMGYYEGRRSKPTGPIKSDWYNPLWIPIFTNEEGEFVLLDLDPAPKGKVGQLVEFSRGRGVTKVLAGSFREFLEGVGRDLEAGKYHFDKKRWLLTPADA